MTDQKHTKELLPCPFCGEVPDFPDGRGTQYDLECDCGCASASIQISDLMTIEERMACDDFSDANNWSYPVQYVERAKIEAIELWNTRIDSPLDLRRQRDELREALEKIALIREEDSEKYAVKADQIACEALTKSKG